MRTKTGWRAALLLLIAVATVSGAALAFSGGQVGFSSNPATNNGNNCNVCHGGGVEPMVTLTGPTVVPVGETVVYELIISGGQEVAGGLNVSAVDGELSTLNGATDVQLVFEAATGRFEVTHTQPKNIDAANQVRFQFGWTAPITPTNTTMYGSGNSVNLADSTGGDRAASTQIDVLVYDPAELTESLFLPAVVNP